MKNDSPQVQAIRERFRNSFSDKADALKALSQQIKANQQQPEEALNEAHETLHKLAGSFGMYGYDDLSNLCRTGMAQAQSSDMDGLQVSMRELIGLLEAEH